MKYIQTAWDSYRNMVMSKDAGTVQINETRQAFYAGASVLFTSIMMALDDNDEPTEKDMQRMADIQNEINSFGQSLDRKILRGTREN